MTGRPLPVTIDVLKLVDRGQELVGSLSLRQMPRLCESLVESEGDVAVELGFGRDEGRRAVITGRLRADVHLICQRCLQPMSLMLDATVALGVCSTEEEISTLPEAYDPLLLGDSPQRLAELVEDELILALPTLARHQNAPGCAPVSVSVGVSAVEQVEESRQPNPFAVLGVLKNRDDS